MSKGRIPNQLKKYRKIHGYTQKEVALKLGMKKANLISEWEKGTIAPSFDNLFNLANLYHALIEELYLDYYQAKKKQHKDKEKSNE